VERLLHQDISPKDLAFIIFEPIQGEGGYRIPNREYIRYLYDVTKDRGKHGGKRILLIADEVQAGLGRSGKMWAHEYFDVEVDLMTSAKALQVGATMGTEENFPKEEGDACRISSTWGGGAVLDMAMGLKVIETIEKENLTRNAIERGGELLEGLKRLAKKHPNIIADPRGRGLFLGMDIAGERPFDPKAKEIRNEIVDMA